MPRESTMSSYQYSYVMKNVTKVFPGGREILRNITLSFLPNAKIGVLGANGAGKSTLLKIMAGLDEDFSGEAWASDGLKIGYLEQEPVLNKSKTVEENVMEGLSEIKDLLDRFNQISQRFAEPLDEKEMNILLEEQGNLQETIDALGGWDLERKIEVAMDALRCPPADTPIETVSGGELRRIALCKLLLQKPDILLLDEPTNHLDAESVAWLEQHLEEYTGTVLMVTHDRYFLDNVTGWILEIDRGQGIPYQGNYSAWLEQKEKRLLNEHKEETARQRVLKKELEWIQQSPRARQSKSRARITAYDNLLRQSQERKPETAQIIIPVAPRLGTLVLEAKNISKAFENRLLIEDLNFSLPPGGIVGVIGPNGAGKTTLFKLIAGIEDPNSGKITAGETVKLGYVDQSRDSLDSTKSVWEEISSGLDEIDLGKRKMQSRAYVAQFNFKGADQQKKVGQLSGGERNRVHLAKMLKSEANVLLLDEPTNDLDVETLRALEDAIIEFAGCIICISHDRWFLDRIATHILAFEGDSQVTWFEGNYQDYKADRQKRNEGEINQPSRIRYKPLIR